MKEPAAVNPLDQQRSSRYPGDPVKRPVCGTPAGYAQHYRCNERPCERCRKADRAYINAYEIRTGRVDQRKVPVELIGALFTSSADSAAQERLVEFLGTESVDACIQRSRRH
jgi:hypothetical protein